MKKKLLSVLLCILTIITLLVGCGNKNKSDWTEEKEETKTVEEIAEESVNDRFKVIGSCYAIPLDIVLYYDTVTNWVYQSVDSGDEGGILPLLSYDGTTPAKYNPETGEIKY